MGPIKFTPTGKKYQFEADLTTGDWIASLGVPDGIQTRISCQK